MVGKIDAVLRGQIMPILIRLVIETEDNSFNSIYNLIHNNIKTYIYNICNTLLNLNINFDFAFIEFILRIAGNILKIKG